MSKQPNNSINDLAKDGDVVRERRPEIAVLKLALCTAAVMICTALIASILLAAVIKMRQPSEATYQECGNAKQQESSAPACPDRLLRDNSLYLK
jgi:hypothetical protein